MSERGSAHGTLNLNCLNSLGDQVGGLLPTNPEVKLYAKRFLSPEDCHHPPPGLSTVFKIVPIKMAIILKLHQAAQQGPSTARGSLPPSHKN